MSMKVIEYEIPFYGGSSLSFVLKLERDAEFLSAKVKNGKAVMFFLVDEEKEKHTPVFFITKEMILHKNLRFLGTINLKKLYNTEYDTFYHLFRDNETYSD